MFTQQDHFTLKPLEFDLFVGMDVDKRSISATFLTHEGFVKSIKVPYDSWNLMGYVRRHFAEMRAVFVYEAGPTGFGLYDDLMAAGYECLVVSPSRVPATASDRVKTNRIDSRKLAEALRGGQLKGIRVPTPAYRQLRHMAQLREIFVRQLADSKLRIKAVLLQEGIGYPPAKPRGQWRLAVIEELKILSAPAVIRFKLDTLVAHLEFASRQVLSITRRTREYCKSEPELQHNLELLMSIPGVGPIVGTHVLARIGDWRLLRNCHEIGALLGLIPVESSTGDRTRRGSISRMGDPTTRNKLIETAWTAVRDDAEIREFYERVRSRHPAPIAARKAIVAVARKLTMRMYVVLKEQRPYEIRK